MGTSRHEVLQDIDEQPTFRGRSIEVATVFGRLDVFHRRPQRPGAISVGGCTSGGISIGAL